MVAAAESPDAQKPNFRSLLRKTNFDPAKTLRKYAIFSQNLSTKVDIFCDILNCIFRSPDDVTEVKQMDFRGVLKRRNNAEGDQRKQSQIIVQ